MIKTINSKSKEILKKYYGYDKFRPGQREIIDSIMEKKDTLAIMPTGSGKSLCFQIPALLFKGKSIVISPLISLMKDQVDNLKTMDINATYINSSLTNEDISERTKSFINGKCKILYIAPERLNAAFFMEGIASLEIDQVAVDEAHCVSQWGHDFRPSYKRIKDFVRGLESDPVLTAFTATATETVRKDMEILLGLTKPEIFNMGLKRSNIYIEVVKGTDKRKFLTKLITKKVDESGIVYCATRKQVDELYDFLKKKGIKTGKYHAGMDSIERQLMQDAFILEDINIIIATNAFGMGIDKPNIRYIVHYNMPKTLESFYQEIGRAGRDGEPSQSYLLYSESDKRIQRFLIEKSELDEQRLEVANIKLQQMVNFCHTNECLWRFLAGYFNDNDNENCNNCRNCLDENLIESDVTIDSQKVLSCVYRMSQSYGASTVSKVLKGSKAAKVKQKGFERLSTYGIMKENTEQEIRDMINFLSAEGYLEVSHGIYPLLKLNEKSWKVLKGKLNVMKKITLIKKERNENPELFYVLKDLRKRISTEEKVPPYVVFPDYTLKEMSETMPVNKNDLLDIKGVGEKKLQKYGEAFLEMIKNYKRTNS